LPPVPLNGNRSATRIAAPGAASGDTASASVSVRWVRYAVAPNPSGSGTESRYTSRRRCSRSITQYSGTLAVAYSSAFVVVSVNSDESATSTISTAVSTCRVA